MNTYFFEINNSVWYIKEIENHKIQEKFGIEGEYLHGITIYSKNTIYLNKESPEMERTLKHELMHVWLYIYGHNQDEKQFNNEDVCEIVASSNDFINEIVIKYFKER